MKKYLEDRVFELLNLESDYTPAAKLSMIEELLEIGYLDDVYEESYYEHGNGD